MTTKKSCVIFFALWAPAALALWFVGATLPGSVFTGALIAGGLMWLVRSEAKGEEFMIDGLLYSTADAHMIALGKERSEYLGADWGRAAWKKSSATFYQTKNGSFFSVDRSSILVMLLFCPVVRDHRSDIRTYQSPEECLTALMDKGYGGLSAKESSRILNLSLKTA